MPRKNKTQRWHDKKKLIISRFVHLYSTLWLLLMFCSKNECRILNVTNIILPRSFMFYLAKIYISIISIVSVTDKGSNKASVHGAN
ncbi:hypothetical protein CLU79DRAFT_766893 [Phycomyces nitens]|nr:hypothetical protein CLU79DRAFT_766893 [Phycomyces nitens]